MKALPRSLSVVTGVFLLTFRTALSQVASGAPVAVLSQTRPIHVAIPSVDPKEASVDETTSSSNNNPFSASLDRTLNQLDQTNHAMARQDSSFANVGNVFNVSADGQTQYSATGLPGIVFSDSGFAVQFQLAEPRSYSISGSGSFVDTSGGASNFSVTLTGPGGTVASFSKSDFNPNNSDGAVISPTFGTSGTLDPGIYTLSALSGVSGGTNVTGVQASYSTQFSATDTSAAIPLPSSALPGAVLLGAVGVFVAVRRRRLV